MTRRYLVPVGTEVSHEDYFSAFERAQRRRGLLSSTIEKRRSDLATFDRWLGPVSIFDATSEQVELFLDSLTGRDGGDISPKTRYSRLSNLHNFYEWAVRSGLTVHDPTLAIDRPKLRRSLPRPISDRDLSEALNNAGPMMRAWLCLAAFAGLRCKEIAGLDRESILEGEQLIRVLGKGDKERLVPLHPRVLSALERLGMPSRGALFRRPQGSRCSPAYVSREAALFFDSLGIDATLHQCRHWFGTHALRACGDIRVVQELMGHESINSTMLYTAFSPERGRAAVLELDLGGSGAAERARAVIADNAEAVAVARRTA